MVASKRVIRVFLSSPGDVASERAIAFKVLDRLKRDPLLGDVLIEPVAWDDPSTRQPFLATMTLQEVIDKGLPRPSECDVVVVILWARFGQPLDVDRHGRKSDGTPYLSGTELEYMDAAHASQSTGRPSVIVYRRTEKPTAPDVDSPDYDEFHTQYIRVRDFFNSFRDPISGEWRRGYNPYNNVEEFQSIFENDIRVLVRQLLANVPPQTTPPQKNPVSTFERSVDMLQQLFDGQSLYERHGVKFPVVFWKVPKERSTDVNSVLGNLILSEDTGEHFAFRDDKHLQALIDSGRRVEDDPTFVFTSMDPDNVKISAQLGTYFDMLRTCDALQRETELFFSRVTGTSSALSQLPHRQSLHEKYSTRQLLREGSGRSGSIGAGTLIVFNDGIGYRAFVGQRSRKTAIEPEFYHVVPAFMFQPVGPRNTYAREWDIKYQFYREYLEELFNMAETDQDSPPIRYDYFNLHPALVELKNMLADGRASFHVTGIAMNLWTMRPEICTVLLIYDPQWYEQVSVPDFNHTDVRKLKFTWETDRRRLVSVAISTDDEILADLPSNLYARMTPQGSAAFWSGVDLARDILAER